MTDLKFKVVVVGDSNVGKTSIVVRLTTDTFYSGGEPTIGVSNSRYVASTSDGPIELSIWDTAGQEIYHSLVPLYSRSASVCIVVCSTDLSSSINNIKNWIKVIEESCHPLPPIILALNKIDLVKENDSTLQSILKAHPKCFTDAFSVSALTGEGITELFLSAAIHSCRSSGTRIGPSEEAPSRNGNMSYCC